MYSAAVHIYIYPGIHRTFLNVIMHRNRLVSFSSKYKTRTKVFVIPGLSVSYLPVPLNVNLKTNLILLMLYPVSSFPSHVYIFMPNC